MLTKDSRDWIGRARDLAPMIEAAAARTEQERRIPDDVLAAMHEARLFHMLLPELLGGGAADLVTFNQMIETVAAADASPAWCSGAGGGELARCRLPRPEDRAGNFRRSRCADSLGAAGGNRQGAGR